MKRIIFLTLIMLLTNLKIDAQHQECLTPSPPPPSWLFNPKLRASSTEESIHYISPFLLKIYVHIVRSSNGTGLGLSVPNVVLTKLNSDFQGTNIQFQLKGFDFIDNDRYYVELTENEAYELFTINRHNDAINIYILGTSTYFGGAGMAANIPATSYLVHGEYYNTSTLPHEMGHCLGLYHTHHGTSLYERNTTTCSELVDNSNSTHCGDYIADTPADPYIPYPNNGFTWSINSCNYVGTSRDANGQLYKPDPTLFMSYSYKPCRAKFTPMQIERMHDFIQNDATLRYTIVPFISGPSAICDQATYTISNLPPGATVRWSGAIKEGRGSLNIISGQGTDEVTFSLMSTGGGLPMLTLYGQYNIYADITVAGQTIRLEKSNITVGTPGRPSTWMYQTPVYSGESATFDICYNASSPNQAYFINFNDQGYTDIPYLTYSVERMEGDIVQITKGLNALKITPKSVGTQRILVRAQNECGISSPLSITLRVGACQGTIDPGTDPITVYSISPNPATSFVNIKLEENTETNMELLT